MRKMTAKEARALSEYNSVEAKVVKLLETIKKVAETGKTEINTGYHHKEDGDFWNDGGYNTTPKWKEAIKMLEDLGYTAKFHYFEGALVDMYTVVKW